MYVGLGQQLKTNLKTFQNMVRSYRLHTDIGELIKYILVSITNPRDYKVAAKDRETKAASHIFCISKKLRHVFC